MLEQDAAANEDMLVTGGNPAHGASGEGIETGVAAADGVDGPEASKAEAGEPEEAAAALGVGTAPGSCGVPSAVAARPAEPDGVAALESEGGGTTGSFMTGAGWAPGVGCCPPASDVPGCIFLAHTEKSNPPEAAFSSLSFLLAARVAAAFFARARFISLFFSSSIVEAELITESPRAVG